MANKPAGLSLDGSENSFVSHLRAFRSLGGVDDPHLSSVRRIDRDVSGATLLAATKSVSASFVQQPATEQFEQEYIACADVKTDGPSQGQIHVEMECDRSGSVREDRRRSGKLVSVRFEILERRRSRVLLRLVTFDGSRAVRAAMGSVGMVVEGECLGGRVLDSAVELGCVCRLMLHLRALSWTHPVLLERHRTEVPLPWSFLPWLRGQDRLQDLDLSTLALAIRQTASLRFLLLAGRTTSAVRLVHGDAEGLRGLDVELFDRDIVVWIHSDLPESVIDTVCEALSQFGPRNVYVKRRLKQASRAADVCKSRLDCSVESDVCGSGACVVDECGLRFFVELGTSHRIAHGTGLFLDQRENRQWVRSNSCGAAVLNLFAYTCSFTVAAAAGGASRTTSVDVSKRSLEVGRANLEYNRLDAGTHEFVCDDVADFVERARRRGLRWDMIIVDPPSFGRSRRGVFQVERDYPRLLRCLVGLLANPGWLLACTNSRRVGDRTLRGWLVEAFGGSLLRMERVQSGWDFPSGHGGMRGFRCRVGRVILDDGVIRELSDCRDY